MALALDRSQCHFLPTCYSLAPMDDARSQLILQRQAKRYQFLRFVFAESGASELKHIPNSRIKQELGLEDGEFADIWHYLRGEDLLRSGRIGACAISHRGIVEMEESILNPKGPTEHFASIVFQTFNSPVYGGVQGGGQENQQVVVLKPDTHE